LKEAANLDISDAPSNPAAFAAWQDEPPPAPKLHSKGVIAMDITEQFVDAAQREFYLKQAQTIDITC